MSNHREVLETWFKRVWAEEDANAIDQMLVPETAASGLGPKVHDGPAQFKGFQKGLLGLVSNVDISIDMSTEDGDWIYSLCNFTAECRRSGKPVAVTGTVIVKIIDGKLVEAYNHFDFLSMFECLGLLPGDTFEKCMCGEGMVAPA